MAPVGSFSQGFRPLGAGAKGSNRLELPAKKAVCGGAPPALQGSYLVVELTNRCSLACVHCSVAEDNHGHHARTGFLDPVLFEDILTDLVSVGARFGALIPFWLGEPLLHPHFAHLYRSALRAAQLHQVFGQIEVHTNGTHLDFAGATGLLNLSPVPQVWHFSLDAASVETYLRVKGVDRFEKVESQIERWLARKVEIGARWPRPVFQFIVGSNNRGEVRAFRDRWLERCVRLGLPTTVAAGHVPPGESPVVFFRQLDCPTAELQERENDGFRKEMQGIGLELPAAASRGERVSTHNLSPCSGFWKSPVISWRGELTACTRDNLLENQLGSLHRERFSQIWWGRAAAERRSRVATGNYAGLPLCSSCFIPHSLNHGEIDPAEIALQAAYDAEVRNG